MKRPDYTKMTAEQFAAESEATYAIVKAKYDAKVAAGFRLVRTDGTKTSGPAVWVEVAK